MGIHLVAWQHLSWVHSPTENPSCDVVIAMMSIFPTFSTAVTDDSVNIREILAAELTAKMAVASVIISGLLFLGAVAAAIFAARAAFAAAKEADNSHAQLNMVKLAEEQAEASRVSAWLTMTSDTIQIYVRNGNEGPVYDVLCRVMVKETQAQCRQPCVEIWRDSWMALSPAVAGVNRVMKDELHPVATSPYSGNPIVLASKYSGNPTAPKTSAQVELNWADDWHLWDGSPESFGVAVDLKFRDSIGTTWRRSWDGRLEKMNGAPRNEEQYVP